MDTNIARKIIYIDKLIDLHKEYYGTTSLTGMWDHYQKDITTNLVFSHTEFKRLYYKMTID